MKDYQHGCVFEVSAYTLCGEGVRGRGRRMERGRGAGGKTHWAAVMQHLHDRQCFVTDEAACTS